MSYDPKAINFLQPACLQTDNIISHQISQQQFLALLDRHRKYSLDIETSYKYRDLVLLVNQQGQMCCNSTELKRYVLDESRQLILKHYRSQNLPLTKFQLTDKYHSIEQVLCIYVDCQDYTLRLEAILKEPSKQPDLPQLLAQIRSCADQEQAPYHSLSFKVRIGSRKGLRLALKHYADWGRVSPPSASAKGASTSQSGP